MDKEFIEKVNAISTWKKSEGKSEASEFSLSFSGDDNVVRIESEKGSVIYALKALKDLYAPSTVRTKSAEEMLSLLHAVEGAIKRYYQSREELTDAAVILALENLAVKPEYEGVDEVMRGISNSLRLQLSMQSYSRDEVRQAVRKILASAQRHNKHSGRRGYLEFIRKHVP